MTILEHNGSFYQSSKGHCGSHHGSKFVFCRALGRLSITFDFGVGIITTGFFGRTFGAIFASSVVFSHFRGLGFGIHFVIYFDIE